jgi:hypothetical protein
MQENAGAEQAKTDELAAAIRDIRERVRSRHPQGTLQAGIEIPALMPILHARDAADAKVAAIGSVNPRPSGPVWWVTSVIPRICSANRRASTASFATLTPPPFPRPPAWICAFTTTLPPSSRAASAASSTVNAALPRGTGTP